jgi:hypothetical protein
MICSKKRLQKDFKQASNNGSIKGLWRAWTGPTKTNT